MGCTVGAVEKPKELVQAARAPNKGASLRPPISCRSFWDQYSVGAKLGVGGFAQVHIAVPQNAERKGARSIHAVKIVDLRNDKSRDASHSGAVMLDENEVAAVREEVEIWSKVSAAGIPLCVQLLDVFWDRSLAFMVMERCDGSLIEELLRLPSITEAVLGKYWKDMALAVAALHSNKIVHRDIKPDNFFISSTKTLKLGDFGLATSFTSGTTLKKVCGTAPFMSPEMLKGKGYDEKTDVWSLGVLMYTLTYGQFPYISLGFSADDMKKAIASPSVPPSFTSWRGMSKNPSYSLEDLLRSILNRNASKRPSAAEVLEDSFWQVVVDGQADYDWDGELIHTDSQKQQQEEDRQPMIRSAIRAGAFSQPLKGKHKTATAKTRTDDLIVHEQQQAAAAAQLAAKEPLTPSFGPSNHDGKNSDMISTSSQSTASTTCSGIQTTAGVVSSLRGILTPRLGSETWV